MTDERLERIEDKVDKMHIAIVAMARMEERMITVFKRLDSMDMAEILRKLHCQSHVCLEFMETSFAKNILQLCRDLNENIIGVVLPN